MRYFKFMRPPYCLICALIILGLSHAGYGATLDRIISVSPSWDGFTNMDGTGLYHEILAAIFSAHNIQVIHKYTNATRGIHMVQKGLADLYTCKSDINEFKDLMMAQYPMYEGIFYAIFKRERIQTWNGVSSLSGKKVVWRRGYYRPSEFNADFIILETESGISALAQVILNRGDFYIDDLNLINDSISKSKLLIDQKDYAIEPVGKRSYHPVFKNSARGKQIMALFDRGIERLHRTGQLKAIFLKWHHPYPAYAIP